MSARTIDALVADLTVERARIAAALALLDSVSLYDTRAAWALAEYVREALLTDPPAPNPEAH